MVRLAISVEGLTEERFVQRLITPHLQSLGIYATPLLLGGKGGDVSFPRIKNDLNHLAKSFDKVSTLYDFYGFRGKTSDDDKSTLEQKIADTVADPLRSKIIPYVQMYEFEGLLFTSPEAIENNICERGLKDWAETILKQFSCNPEAINDSPQTAPSKRLKGKSDYLKTVHGPNIAQDIGLTLLREKCAGFNGWINQLESLAA